MSARAADETLLWSRLEWSALDESARACALTRPVQVVATATREAVAAVLDGLPLAEAMEALLARPLREE